MTKYEHLLAKDPIGAFKKIKEDYLRYFKYAYRVDNKDIDNERMDKLKCNDNLYKSPFLEILPEYEAASGFQSISDLAKDEDLVKAFGSEEACEQFVKEFIEKGLMDYVPYGHQLSMLKEAFCNKKNVVITSGTGSGKTESFLLPLFAEIFKEAKTWEAPKYEQGAKWYSYTDDKGGYRPCQRSGEKRKAAMRALVMYPMNALVEDQMARLRSALDSDDVRKTFDAENGLKGNRIYFGRYTGATIGNKSSDLIKGKKEKEYREKVHSELEDLHNKYFGIKKYCNSLKDEGKKKNAMYVSTRLDEESLTAEMVTRWDMQECPPDIMITNTSMLSIMLMRRAEGDIFDKTRQWLEEDKNHIFHLIIDELHLYRGTPGSEVACLLRMLLDAIGLPPVKDNHRNPQLRVLASSASLGDGDAPKKFLEEFFGVYDENDESFCIQNGTDYVPQKGSRPIDYGKFKLITPEFVSFDADSKITLLNSLAKEFGCDNIIKFIEEFQGTIFHDLIAACKEKNNGCLWPICYEDLHGKDALFPDEESLRGFLIFRGYVDKLQVDGRGLKHRLPRFRFHQFFKFVEGLWGELKPTGNEHWNPVGELSYMANEVGPNKHKVLELLRCESCGELFIGGNRKIVGNRQDETYFFTLNYPDLEKIPNSNPTPMVQNKSFAEYAIFWPTKHEDNKADLDTDDIGQGNARRNDKKKVAFLNGETNFNKTNANACWKSGYLNVDTGEFSTHRTNKDNTIEGYIYSLNPRRVNTPVRKDLIQALPCCCPKCKQNYAYRKYTKSPIRSFRTGTERSNQLLSKELMYQLSEGSEKLIGFSDSREDAAQQAFGIEKEHYRDMVRLLFIKCIQEQENGAGIVNLDGFIGENLNGSLVKKLLKLGINPAGPDYKMQFCDEKFNRHWSEAFDFENLERRSPTLVAIRQDYKDTVETALCDAVFGNSFGKYMGVNTNDSGIGYICCRREENVTSSNEYKYLSKILEPTGVGVFDFIDAYIRILGDNHCYYQRDDLTDNTAERQPIDTIDSYDLANFTLKKPIMKFARLHKIDHEKLGNAVYNFLLNHVTIDKYGLQLDLRKLAFKPAKEGDLYYECPNCHRKHLNKGYGFCTTHDCMRDFDNETTITGNVKDLWNDSFIPYDILVEPKSPMRLHTEELTGQTDSIQERLLNFKDLILVRSNDERYRLGYELSKSIDMINVTTTMEVGVDIGSLEAIFQGNMPPTRYNYQQRVGRGGRRGQAFSAAFTFCRGRSHDNYYYYNATKEMLGSTPVAPSLSLAPYMDKDDEGKPVFKMKKSIMKRVIVKSVFREAMKDIYKEIKYDDTLIDTAGEFGRVSEWEENRSKVQSWIINHKERINYLLELYFGQFNKESIIDSDIEQIKNWINSNLIEEVSESVSACANSEIGLAQYMSERGFLPRYGLPSDLREFYHGYDREHNKVKSIDRSIEMAITEFAPGQIKTKDKGEYRIDGLTLPMKADQKRGLIFMSGNVNDPLYDRYKIHFNKNNKNLEITDIEVADRTNNALEVSRDYDDNDKMLIVPQAFRSFKIWNNYGTHIENNDKQSSYSQSTIYSKDSGNSTNIINLKNLKASAYGINGTLNNKNETPDEAEVWHINTNNGRFFTGMYSSADSTPKPEKIGNKKNFMFFARDNSMVQQGDQTIDIAIGSRKSTEMIKLELVDCDKKLNLDIEQGNRSAIRAAFFSAAFLIQRNLADKLDVQPDEIEISEKLGGRFPTIYLSDALPNGAGLVSYLFYKDNLETLLKDIVGFKTGFMKSLIEDDHLSRCLTACQKCLKTYSNRGFHHVLDWRLGVGIIRIMLDKDYDFGYTDFLINKLDMSKNRYDELTDFQRILDICAQKLDANISKGQYSWIKECEIDEKECTVIYHPLWDYKQIPLHSDARTIRYFNTFKLLRSELNEDISVNTNQSIQDNKLDSNDDIILI